MITESNVALERIGASRRAIYGLFVGQRCVYVGQSLKPFSVRGKAHKWSGKQFDALRVFRWVNSKWDANRIERQVMEAYWRRGQAELSTAPARVVTITAENAGVFSSWREAAAFFGVAHNTVKAWERYGDWYGADGRRGGKLTVKRG